MDTNNPQTNSSDLKQTNPATAENIKNVMKQAGLKTTPAINDAADATFQAMEKAVDKTSETLKKASDSVKKVFNKGGATADSGGTVYNEDAFKKHWKTSYWISGGAYDDYQPAYQYGAELAENERKNLNRPWEQVESSAHAAWELYNRDSEISWNDNKDAIKFGWDTVTGKTN